MTQDTILQVLMIVLVAIAYIVHAVRNSKQESKPINHLRASSKMAKPISLETQEASISWEKEESSLCKNSMSRAKKILNRSLLRQSILKTEILRKKY